MSEDLLRYDLMVEAAKRAVARQALRDVVRRGGVLPGGHHFYITFRTHADGVDLPDYLKAQYPEEMTIVLQYQFHDLSVFRQHFEVTLSFGGAFRRLVIPFDSLVTFADPSVSFVLQFSFDDDGTLPDIDIEEEEPLPAATPAEATLPTAGSGADRPVAASTPETGTVVALDAFRKK
jgi:uncharacterized protein